MADPGEPDRPSPALSHVTRARELISPVILSCDPETFLARMVESFDLERFYDTFPALFGREPESQDSFS